MIESLISSFLVSDVSESLRSFRGNERWWANGSGRSPKMSKWVNPLFVWGNRSFAHFWAKKSDSLGKPMSKNSSPAETTASKEQSSVPISLLKKIVKNSHLSKSLQLGIITCLTSSTVVKNNHFSDCFSKEQSPARLALVVRLPLVKNNHLPDLLL